MEKSADAFRTISEAADELDVPQHVLRFWESKFPQIKPLKRAGGRRYYRPQDIDLLRAIKQLLYAEGFTIKGVQRILKERGAKVVATGLRGRPSTAASAGDPDTADAEGVDRFDTTDGAGATGIEAGTKDEMSDDMAASEARTASLPRRSVGVEEVERLREILAELERCADVLAAARRA